MHDEVSLTRALQEMRKLLAGTEWRASMSKAAGHDDRAAEWEQSAKPIRERIEVLEMRLAVLRGEQPSSAVLDLYRKQAGVGGNDER